MEMGIIPDILLCRSATALSPEMRSKIALFCNVAERNVISAIDIKSSIYEIPEMLHSQGYDEIVLEHFRLDKKGPFFGEWEDFMRKLRNPKQKVRIAVVGKYISLQGSYRSIYEALLHGAVANEAELEVLRVDSEEVLEKKYRLNARAYFNKNKIDGILVPGGFGNRGIEGKISAINYARTEGIPLFGICLGLQTSIIEFARNACGLTGANSKEFDPTTPHPVISLLIEQEIVEWKGGTMRLGAYKCALLPGSKIAAIYETDSVMERHRHRYEVTMKYLETLERGGLRLSGINPQTNLVEAIEIPEHPWFICTQYHPEFKSKPTAPHPLFRDFIRASLDAAAKRKS
jgi:CTP synthase